MTAIKFSNSNIQEAKNEPSNLAVRLREVVGANQTATWAKKVGIAAATIHGILEKGAIPTTKNLIKIAQFTDISLNWLLVERGPKNIHGGNTIPVSASGVSPHTPQQIAEKSDVFLMPRIDRLAEQLNLGPDANMMFAEELAFRAQWLKHQLQVDPNRIVLVRIKGDAMNPTLGDGDVVMVDTREDRVRHDALYALQINGVLAVKRLQQASGGSLIIHSDNEDYERILISPLQAGNLKVVGVVVWVGRKV